MNDCELVLPAITGAPLGYTNHFHVHFQTQRKNEELDQQLLTVKCVLTQLHGHDALTYPESTRRRYEFTYTNVNRVEFWKTLTHDGAKNFYSMKLWMYNFDKGREEQIITEHLPKPLFLKFSMQDLQMSWNTNGENRWETCLGWNVACITRDEIYGTPAEKYYKATNSNWKPPMFYRRVHIPMSDDEEDGTYANTSQNPYLTRY